MFCPFTFQPPVTAAIISAIALFAASLIGWRVTSVIGKLNRQSTEALGHLASGISAQQLEVARMQAETTRNQLEVNRQKMILDLLPRRLEVRTELFDAIDARGQEIIQSDYRGGAIKTDALQRLWRAQQASKVLFGNDVQELIDQIHDQLKNQGSALMKIRTYAEQAHDLQLIDANTAAAYKVVQLKAELSTLMDKYSMLGHVRASK